MSLARQVGLLSAGCQPWNVEVVASSQDRFAYCATLAIYIYQLDRRYNEFKLISIMSEHKKTITAISWNPKNPDLFASSSTDNIVIVWNVPEQKVVTRLSNARSPPCSLGWCVHDKDCLGFVHGRGPLYLWNINSESGISIHKEAQNFMSDVCQFRWHHSKQGKLMFGHMDGSVSLFCAGQKPQKHVLRPESLDGSDEEDPITALEWDPLSTEYFLIASTHNGVRLLDSEALTVIMCFQLPSAAAQVHTLAWINTAPGMFITGDTHTGVMRLWNVSKSSPIENLRLKKTGFHALAVFSTSPGTNPDSDSEGDSVNSKCMAKPPSTPLPGSRYALPPAHAVCTFLDGGVGLYDLGRRKWHFLRDLGHVETIFDCRFKPDNPDLLATGSFDGTIKVWDINSLNAVYTSPGNEGVIYCLSWAPADLNCICAATSKQGAFIWDLNRGRVIKRFTEHAKAAVFSVSWNQKDSRRIASAGGDGFCVVRQVDGQMLMRYKHPAPVYGCDWNPHNKDMLATGCEDKNVRVYYLATNSEQPLKVFSGHTAKVFHVRWSPLREGILSSGSDDCTIRVWDYTQECCTAVLQGHNGPVRGLLWNPEIPYMLVSGSWDYTIRIWDTRDGACLDTLLDHGADVYGLTCHPDHPFTMASCSRDSTVRVWSLAPLVQPLEINIITKQPWNEVFANPVSREQAYSLGTPPLLVGKSSRELRLQMENESGDARVWTLKQFSKFFASPAGVKNLWELVEVLKGTPESMLEPSYRSGIMHMSHITKYKTADAQELEMAKVSKFGGGLGAPSKEERLREAANIHIKLGNIQRYCEILAGLGEWEKALAVAPGVSLAYWKSLAERRAESLSQEDSDQCVPYYVATGDADKLAHFFTSRGQLQDALLGAAASHEGSIATPYITKSSKSTVNGFNEKEINHLSLLKKTTEELADWHFRNGSPVLAACCHLVVEDGQKAISKLIRGNELELSVNIGLILTDLKPLTNIAIELLARRCERIGKWELAVDLLKMTDSCDKSLAQLCSRCAASMDETNALHAKAGFPTMDECLEVGERYKTSGDITEAVMYYLMSTQPEVGLELGLQDIKAKLSRSKWRANDVFSLLQFLGSIQTEKLQQHKCSKFAATLLAYSAYIGGLVAIRRGYDAIVPALFKHAITWLKADYCDANLSESLLQSELEAWTAKQAIMYNRNPSTPHRKDVAFSMEQQSIYEELVRKAGSEEWQLECGPDMVTGSNLPSHSDVHLSALTHERIQGPSYFLEDGRTVISINEALMWAKVNPFSPLGSCVRINPF